MRDDLNQIIGTCNFGGAWKFKVQVSNDETNWHDLTWEGYDLGQGVAGRPAIFVNPSRGSETSYVIRDEYGKSRGSSFSEDLESDGYRFIRVASGRSTVGGQYNWANWDYMAITKLEFFSKQAAVSQGDLSEFNIGKVEISKNSKSIQTIDSVSLLSSDENKPSIIFNELIYVDKGDLIQISAPDWGCPEKVANPNYAPETTLIYNYSLTSQIDIPTGGGKYGHGLKTFESSTDYLEIGDHSAWELGEAFTIEAWIKLDSITDHAVIAAQDDEA